MLFMKSLLIIEKSRNQNTEPLNRNNHPHLLAVSFSPTRLIAGRTIKNWTSRKNVLGVARCVLRLLSCCRSSFWRTSAVEQNSPTERDTITQCSDAMHYVKFLAFAHRDAHAPACVCYCRTTERKADGALAVWIGPSLSAGTGGARALH